jgi:hypothetical protein
VTQIVLGLVLGGFVVTLVFGLATGRVAWRQQGCCPADPAKDLRMRDPEPGPPTPQHRTAPPDA